jgi:CheY-like chemotaxis protein
MRRNIPMTPGNLKRQFGNAVKGKRSELHISQEELADRAGLHRTYISDVERGARNLSLESIEKLAAALELSVSGLFARAGDQRTTEPVVEILLVEDTPEDVELTLRAFRKARFVNPVHVVGDGEEALDFLFGKKAYANRREENPPGLVLLDLDLPKIGGLEVLRRMKADWRTRNIPVVVLTVSRHYHDAVECQRLGVETYITKPVDFRNLSEVTPRLRLEWSLVKPQQEESV